MASKTVKCSRCKNRKFRKDFYKDGGRKLGLDRYCKDCRNPMDTFRHKKWRYGISKERYLRMKITQKGLCALCKHRETIRGRVRGKRKDLGVDHDHKTNKIRALLCSRCNRGLGIFKDDIFLLKTAIAYLESFK